MITINLRNIEEILFKNKKIKNLFPEFKSYFDQWSLAHQFSFLRPTATQAILNLLNNLNERHTKILEDFFGELITIDKLSTFTTKNIQKNINSLEEYLDEFGENIQICPYRNGEEVYLTLWEVIKCLNIAIESEIN